MAPLLAAGAAVLSFSFLVKRLNPQDTVARTGELPLDPTVFHTLELTVQGDKLQVALDGRLLSFYQGIAVVNTVPVPNTWDSPKVGTNDGALGLALSSEENRGKIGGQMARNLYSAGSPPRRG